MDKVVFCRSAGETNYCKFRFESGTTKVIYLLNRPGLKAILNVIWVARIHLQKFRLRALNVDEFWYQSIKLF